MSERLLARVYTEKKFVKPCLALHRFLFTPSTAGSLHIRLDIFYLQLVTVLLLLIYGSGERRRAEARTRLLVVKTRSLSAECQGTAGYPAVEDG